MYRIDFHRSSAKHWLSLLLLFCATQGSAVAQDLGQAFQENFGQYRPSEKLYLHTDKPNYFVRDTIWFKGYLLDAASHHAAPSNFIYLDLIDQYDTVVVARKIKRDSVGGFSGFLPLDRELPEGAYTLRGYSMWMRNFPKEYYFYKTIQVERAFEAGQRLRVEAQWSDSAVLLRLDLGTGAYQKLTCRVVNLTTGKAYRSPNPQRDHQGLVALTARGLSPGDAVSVEVTGVLDGRPIKRTLRAEVPRAQYAVQFLPEGGALVAGGVRRVAFKALSASGASIDLTGCILDPQGDTVAHLASIRDGMGVVSIPVEAGDLFTAHTYSKDGVFQSTPLPAVHPDGVVVWANVANGRIDYWVEKVGAVEAKKLYAVLHTRGRLQYVLPLQGRVARHSVPFGELPAGVSHLVVVDEERVPLAERLFFVPPQLLPLSVETDRPTYGARSLVGLTLQLPEGVEADLSVSVTDDGWVARNNEHEQIVASLLLTSDLHGTIEHPNDYIGSPDVDLLMLTHGWRRFEVHQLLDGTAQSTPYYIEQGQSITGRVVGGYKKNLLQGQVFAQIISTDSTRLSPMDRTGRFEVGDLDIAGTKRVALKAVHPKNLPLDARFEVDTVPAAALPWAVRRGSAERFDPLAADTAAAGATTVLSDQRVYKSIEINEVVVRQVRRAPVENTYNEEQTNSTPNRLSSKMSYYASPFNKYLHYINPNYSLRELLVHAGYVNSSYDYSEESKRRSYFNSLFFIIDGEKFQIERSTDLEKWSYFGDQIAAIEVIDGARGFGYGVGGKIIAIETTFHNPEIYWNRINPELLVVDFVGYDRCDKEFYTPSYTRPKGADEPADYRPTVYWNPNVSAGDQLQFYTTDHTGGTYTIQVEGVAPDGRPIHHTQTLTIETEGKQ